MTALRFYTDERTAMRRGVISPTHSWIREQAKYYLETGVPIEVKVVWQSSRKVHHSGGYRPAVTIWC